MLKNTYILLLLLFMISNSFAQFNTTVDVSTYYDDNLYRSPEPESDLLTVSSLQIAYSPEKSALSFYINPSYFSYRTNNLRSFFMNELGFRNQFKFGTNKKHTFYLGLEYDTRLNGEDYNYYDYNQLYGYLSSFLNLNWFFLRAGYNYRYRGYSNFPDLTNNQHYAFIQVNKSFQTRTSVIMEADIGYKSFAGQDYLLSSTSSGKGRGRNQTNTTTTTTEIEEIPSLSQAIFLVRIAQSLHTKIGLNVQYRKQISLNADANFNNENDYYQDEELFDDPFSYESDSYSSQLTWVLPWNFQAKINGAYTNKTYISEFAYTSIEDTVATGGIRKDEQTSANFNLTKKFFPKKKWLQTFNLFVNYAVILNKSNSYWYDYKNNYISGGFSWKF